MHFTTTVLTALTAMAAVVTASPLMEKRQTTVAPPPLYYLQTKVVGNLPDCGSNKDGLWLYSYHTGAGLGDAGLSSNKSIAMQSYFNGTQPFFNFTGAITGYPLGITYGPYQQFSVATISVPLPTSSLNGFFFNETGLQWNQSIAGWLACDWWHGVPQLFNLNGYNNGPLPSSCSHVQLYPVAV